MPQSCAYLGHIIRAHRVLPGIWAWWRDGTCTWYLACALGTSHPYLSRALEQMRLSHLFWQVL
jgi:hypothetical protein